MGFFGAIRDWFYAPVVTAAVASTAPEPVEKAAQPAGVDGVAAFGGWLQSRENNSALAGAKKWTTYANTINSAVVATGVRYFGNLLAGTEWHLEENKAGGKDARRGVEVVQDGLIDAPMVKPWPMVVRKASMYRLFGFSLHAGAVRRRSDGMIVYSALEHRAQHTIERWLRKDERSPFDEVLQRSPSGVEYPIPLDECLYCYDDTLTDSPDGVGLLRHVVQLVQRLDRYQALEGSAYESDLGGTPIAYAPIAELLAGAPGGTDAEKKAYVQEQTRLIRELCERRVKTPEQLIWMLLDSATYVGRDPNTISALRKWFVEVLKSETANLPGINAVIGRLEFAIARVLGIEFAMMGDGEGARAVHEDKTGMFATNLATTLSEIGIFATNQLARRLVRLNGLDPETATPKLVAEPISTDAIEAVTRALANIGASGMRPDDPARNVLRKRMRLPPEPEPTEESLLPRAPLPQDPNLDPVDPVVEGGDDPPDKPTPEPTRKRAPKYSNGDRVIALADHMAGMKGMAGKIAIARSGSPPYYGVRFDDQDAMPGTHKWLAEDEIEAETDDTEGM